jgi:hypothetical protein
MRSSAVGQLSGPLPIVVILAKSKRGTACAVSYLIMAIYMIKTPAVKYHPAITANFKSLYHISRMEKKSQTTVSNALIMRLLTKYFQESSAPTA